MEWRGEGEGGGGGVGDKGGGRRVEGGVNSSGVVEEEGDGWGGEGIGMGFGCLISPAVFAVFRERREGEAGTTYFHCYISFLVSHSPML